MRRPIGRHRMKHPEGLEDGVWVTAGTSFQVPESAYLEQGYEPALETLPWGPSTPGDGDTGKS